MPRLQAENDQEPCPLHAARVPEEADTVWLSDLSKPEPMCRLHLAGVAHAADRLEILLRAGWTPLPPCPWPHAVGQHHSLAPPLPLWPPLHTRSP